MSNESKHPSHALHSAKMVFGPIMETTMKYSGFDPNYLAGFEEKTALKLWAITCRGSWSPFDLKTHQNADTIVINLLIKPWMPHFCVSINSANPAWGFSTFISQSRQREREEETEGASDYRVRVIYREIQRKKYSAILTDIEDSNVCNIQGFYIAFFLFSAHLFFTN